MLRDVAKQQLRRPGVHESASIWLALPFLPLTKNSPNRRGIDASRLFVLIFKLWNNKFDFISRSICHEIWRHFPVLRNRILRSISFTLHDINKLIYIYRRKNDTHIVHTAGGYHLLIWDWIFFFSILLSRADIVCTVCSKLAVCYLSVIRCSEQRAKNEKRTRSIFN